MNRHSPSLFIRFLRDESALALIEFAFVLPILLIISVPIFNFITYVMTVQKTNKTAATLADMIVMSTPADGTTTPAMANNDKLILSNQSLEMVLDSSAALMQPFGFPDNAGKTCGAATIDVYSVIKTAGVAGTVWKASYAGGAATVTNNITPAAPPASLNAGFTAGMYEGENTIVVEVSCGFVPPVVLANGLGLPMLSATTIKSVYRYPARNGALPFVFNN
jgi:Flp pilus assembly protein TadG